MKTGKGKWTLLSLALSLGMVGCSESNLPDVNPDVIDPNGTRTLTFVISNASDHMTRGDDDAVFREGKENESKVDNLLLVFFDKNGKFFTAAEPLFDKGSAGGTDHTQEGMYITQTGQVAIRAKDGDKPTHVLCIINGKGKKFSDDIKYADYTLNEVDLSRAKISKDEMLKLYHTFAASLNDDATGPAEPLMMTNSVYVTTKAGEDPEAEPVQTLYDITEIDEKCFIYPDDPRLVTGEIIPKVHIDVERVNAVVTVKSELDGKDAEGEDAIKSSKIMIGGEVKTVKPEIQNIGFGQLARKSHLIKSLEGRETYDVLNWESKLYPRSYWATSPVLTPWNEKDKDGRFLDSNSDYEYFTFNQYAEGDVLTYYPQENTTTEPTCVVLTAILKDDKENVLEDMIDISGNRKSFMTVEDFKKHVATELQKKSLTFKYVDDDGQTVVSDDWAPYVKLKRTENPEDKSFHMVAYIEPVVGICDEVYAIPANEELSHMDPVLYYKGGMCYYYVEIKHDLSRIADEDGNLERVFGVVRNHAYEVTLKTLKGLGSPIYDPNVEIIPDRPDEILELEAEIHPLKWKVVKQDADIQ